jgi:hypothetical protein
VLVVVNDTLKGFTDDLVIAGIGDLFIFINFGDDLWR